MSALNLALFALAHALETCICLNSYTVAQQNCLWTPRLTTDPPHGLNPAAALPQQRCCLQYTRESLSGLCGLWSPHSDSTPRKVGCFNMHTLFKSVCTCHNWDFFSGFTNEEKANSYSGYRSDTPWSLKISFTLGQTLLNCFHQTHVHWPMGRNMVVTFLSKGGLLISEPTINSALVNTYKLTPHIQQERALYRFITQLCVCAYACVCRFLSEWVFDAYIENAH